MADVNYGELVGKLFAEGREAAVRRERTEFDRITGEFGRSTGKSRTLPNTWAIWPGFR